MAQYELNLRDYLRIIRKHKWTILLTFLLCTIISTFFISTPPVVYSAKTTVKIEERKTIAGLLTETIVYSPGNTMVSEASIIKGFPVMRRVAVRLGLMEESAPLERAQQIVPGLQERISVKPLASTNIIEITTTGDDPKETVELASAVAATYIEENLEAKRKQSKTVRQFIEDQLAAIERRLNANEETLRKFSDGTKTPLIDPALKNRLSQLELELIGLSQRYTEKHPRPVKQTRDQIRDLKNQMMGSSETSADRDKLNGLELKMKELLGRYTEKHPAVEEARKEIEGLKKEIADSDQELELARLQLEVDVNKNLYAMLKQKLEEARIAEAQQISSVSVVDPAFLLPAPRAPKKELSVLMGMLLGLVLGAGLAFIRENLDTSIGTVEDVEHLTKLPVIGVIPSMKGMLKKEKRPFFKLKKDSLLPKESEKEERGMRMIAHYKPRSSVAEAYRNIQTNLKIGPLRKTVLITSSGVREGKSTVAINLALVMAQAGLKTLLVSADLRRPVVAKMFGIAKEPGLSELVMGTVKPEEALNNVVNFLLGEMSFEDVMKAPGIDNIWVLTSGRLHAQPVELLESKELGNYMEAFKNRFDVIVLDSPPVLPVTDASILARKVDCALIVYEIGRTSQGALMRTKMQLESVGAKIAGVLINNTNPEVEPIASYNYYRQYQYYGKEKTDPHAGKSPV